MDGLRGGGSPVHHDQFFVFVHATIHQTIFSYRQKAMVKSGKKGKKEWLKKAKRNG